MEEVGRTPEEVSLFSLVTILFCFFIQKVKLTVLRLKIICISLQHVLINLQHTTNNAHSRLKSPA